MKHYLARMKLPAGFRSLTPRIVTDDPGGLLEFMKRAFGASGDIQPDRPAIVRIGDSVLMVGSAGPRVAMPAFLYLYVPDADVVFRQAVDAGATEIEAPLDTPYGDRRAMVEDRWGNMWQIATFRP
jgi:uncharacterized glyoxalase superfamily protein PhnB